MPYVDLTVNQRWLKPIGNLEDTDANGMTELSFTNAETEAMRMTDSIVGWMYNSTEWETTTPPIIEQANEYLASAIALDFYLSRDIDITVGEQYMPDTLWERGMDILNKIVSGEMEVVDDSGVLLNRIRRNAMVGPRAIVSRARFFPDRQTDRSFGNAPVTSAEKTYRDVTGGE